MDFGSDLRIFKDFIFYSCHDNHVNLIKFFHRDGIIRKRVPPSKNSEKTTSTRCLMRQIFTVLPYLMLEVFLGQEG